MVEKILEIPILVKLLYDRTQECDNLVLVVLEERVVHLCEILSANQQIPRLDRLRQKLEEGFAAGLQLCKVVKKLAELIEGVLSEIVNAVEVFFLIFSIKIP